MRILIYSPPNSRAVDQQSVMELFTNEGHEVFLLTHLPKGDLHANVEQYGVKTFSCGFGTHGVMSYYKHVKFLMKFIRQHKIDVVFAHLQSAGLVSGIASRFRRFRLFYIRHNTDEHILSKNKNAIIVNWLTNKIVYKIIAISNRVSRYLQGPDHVKAERVVRINLGYNFESYLKTDKLGTASQIRQEYPAKLLLLSAARLIPVKRQMEAFQVVKRLVSEGMDVKLLCLSDGPYRPVLEQYIIDNNLQANIFMMGARKNIIDYMEACDLFLHLSESEASNNAVKEMGYCRKTAIVCKDVGDFDDYIRNGVNGYTVDKDNPVEPSYNILKELYGDDAKLAELGNNLHSTIIREFSIENVAPLYDKLLTEK